MASGRAEILRSRQLLRDGNAIRGTRPMCPSRAALVRLSPINSSEFPHDDKLILMRARLAFQSRFRRRSQGTDPVKRVASALLELSSKAGLASAREKGIGELPHRVEAVAVSGMSLSTHTLEGPEPCRLLPTSPGPKRDSLQGRRARSGKVTEPPGRVIVGPSAVTTAVNSAGGVRFVST